MRTHTEALKEIRTRLVYLYGRLDGTFSPPALKEVVEIADEALAASLRICDVFSSAQLKEIFENEIQIYMPKEATDRDRDIVRIVANSVIDVLFAPSTEVKEGKDGK